MNPFWWKQRINLNEIYLECPSVNAGEGNQRQAVHVVQLDQIGYGKEEL